MKHPAKFSDTILDAMRPFVMRDALTIDPFAGTGRVHNLCNNAWGIEVEPEWASMHPKTLVGNALHLPFADKTFTQAITSPIYGNRMSDCHVAKDDSVRHTYTHTLGRQLHDNNAGKLQWGPKYRTFHLTAWTELNRVLDGTFIFNCGNHIRKDVEQPVTEWHIQTLGNLGFTLIECLRIETPGQRHGQNGQKRIGHEWITILTNKNLTNLLGVR